MEELSILFEDADLLVINKPAGLRVIPDGYDSSLPSIRSLLDRQYGKVFIVHRLDKETSGVLLIARNSESHRFLNTQFQEHTIVKHYQALVACPKPFPPNLAVDAPLLVNGDRRHRTVVNRQQGKAAGTEFSLVTQFSHAALISAFPKSGYTHQIRAHALSTGFPLLGDPLYRFPRAAYSGNLIPVFPRTALHAFETTITHPSTGNKMKFISPLPADFMEFISTQIKTAED